MSDFILAILLVIATLGLIGGVLRALFYLLDRVDAIDKDSNKIVKFDKLKK